MRIFVGIVIVVIGASLPIAMLFRLNSLMSRKPAPTPRQVGLLLAFNGVLPVSLITLGMGLLSARLWELPGLRAVTLASSATAVVLLLLLWRTGRPAHRGEDTDGR